MSPGATLFRVAGRRALAGVVAALALGCAPAAEAPKSIAPTIGAAPLWAVSDGDSTVYLFASVHLLWPDSAWRSPALARAFARSDRILFELDPGPAGAARIQEAFAAQGRLEPGARLSALLPPDLAARLAQAAEAHGLNAEALDAMRPWLAAQQIGLSTALRQGADPALGVEAVLYRAALRRAVPIAALETAHDQVNTLAGAAEAAQLHLLESALDDAEQPEDTLRTLAAIWAQGDVLTLTQALDALAQEAGPDLHRAVILDRNARFAARAEEELARTEDVLIVMGAAHLVGVGSVVDLLAANGRAPVRLSPPEAERSAR